jgi:soluble lytic murein transglycosylase-like protein
MTTAICTLALWAIVQSACQQYDLPAETVYALVLAESNGDPQAVGALGELGVAQFQEGTFRWMASLYETGYVWPEDAVDAEHAVDLLCRALDGGRAAHWRGWKRMSFQLVPRRGHRMWDKATPSELAALGVRP